MTEGVVYVGFDGEMTGTDFRRHRLIEIGMAIDGSGSFSARIGWSNFDFEEAALEAIGWTLDDVRSGAPLDEVDRSATAWLSRAAPSGRLIPVGWGVSYFDRPFTDPALPAVTARLHHHSIELNVLPYLCSQTSTYLGHSLNPSGWRDMAKRAAELRFINEVGHHPVRHSARHDAVLALYAWHWFSKFLASSGASQHARFDSPRPQSGTWPTDDHLP